MLVRFFGVGTENFINRDLEAQISHSLFATDGVSVPQIFARFKTGRIEEWIDSKVLQYDSINLLLLLIKRIKHKEGKIERMHSKNFKCDLNLLIV